MEPLKINWNNWNWNGLLVCLSPKRQYISKLSLIEVILGS